MEDNVRAAIELGLDALGISDHYILFPDRQIHWSMPTTGLPDYFTGLQAAREAAGDKLAFRFGVEADYIPETAGRLGDQLAQFPFDYVIGSVHFVGDFPIDESAGHWDALAQDQRNLTIQKYWHLIADMAHSGLFDIVGHADLYKKFGHYATIDLSEDISAALDAIAESGMAVEVNTSGLRYTGEAYPCTNIIRQCHERNIPTLVTADAHNPAHLIRYFEIGTAALKAAGYAHQATFDKRRMELVRF
jgi:histidinol-phosphatase (PHP family)